MKSHLPTTRREEGMSEKYKTVEHERPFKYEEGDLNVTRGCA